MYLSPLVALANTKYESFKKNFKQGVDEVLEKLHDEFARLEQWEGETLHQIVLKVAEDLEMNLGKVAQPLRVAVCGTSVSPPIDVTLSLLGRDKTLNRIMKAVNFIKNSTEA